MGKTYPAVDEMYKMGSRSASAVRRQGDHGLKVTST